MNAKLQTSGTSKTQVGRRSLHIAAACSLALAIRVSAADRTWTGAGGNARWDNPQNWTGNAAPTGSDDNAYFPAGTPGAVLIDADTSIKCIYFRNPGMTLTVGTGANLHFDNQGALVLRADEDATLAGPGTVTFSVNTGENFADTQAAVGKTLTLSARVTGNGFEFNGGGGTIYLANSANDYTNTTCITGSGYIRVDALGNAGAASPLGKGDTIRWTNIGGLLYTGAGGASTDRTLHQNIASAVDADIVHAGTGTLTFAGPITGNASAHAFKVTVNDPAAAVNFAGVVSNGGAGALSISKYGAGRLTLSNANTYTGTTLLEAGVLALSASGSLNPAAPIRLRGGTLLLNAGTPAANYTAAFGPLQADGGAVSIEVAPGATSAQITFSAFTDPTGSLDFIADGLGTTTRIFITGLLPGLVGPWATVNGGADVATYSASGLQSANLPVQHVLALGTSVILNAPGSAARIDAPGTSGGITLGANPTEVGLLAQETPTDALISFGGSRLVTPLVQLALNGGNLTLGATSGDGAVTPSSALGNRLVLVNVNAPGGPALTVNAATANNGGNAARINKNGPGDVVLAGPVTHTGGTTLNGGTLTLTNAAALTWPAGGISGSGNFRKTGDGALIFPNAANTYSGTTTVSRGIVTVIHNDTFGDKNGPTVVENGAALDLIGTDAANGLRLGNERVYAEGAGPDGLGALRITGPQNQFWALSFLDLTGDILVNTPRRLDLRGDNTSLTALN
ncbi:MAG: autotransporter-associated beta strand repeat-containing protein, partial [Verrucomicrobiota bacterium]|nr:autotransporter-associated beta strand repeat-containing protein [Verrucomicrobiota bacterium]